MAQVQNQTVINNLLAPLIIISLQLLVNRPFFLPLHERTPWTVPFLLKMAPSTVAQRPPKRGASRILLLKVVAVVLLAAAAIVAFVYPRMRQPVGLVVAGLALGVIRWWVFGGSAVPFARMGRLFQSRRAKHKGS